MEEVREHSVFYRLVSHIPLKYGRASSSMREDGIITEPTKLVAFSADYELPQKELIDPLGQAYQRHQWRNVGLIDSATDAESESAGDEDS